VIPKGQPAPTRTPPQPEQTFYRSSQAAILRKYDGLAMRAACFAQPAAVGCEDWGLSKPAVSRPKRTETDLAVMPAIWPGGFGSPLPKGMDCYLDAGDEMSRRVGRLSGRFEHAEGWRRHLHLGFSASEQDPLADALGEHCHVTQPLNG
jgi:hypothetical protein